MIKSLRIVVPLWSILTFPSCTEPRQDSPDNLQLSVKEADLTSVTLSLHTQQITYPATLTLTRNSQPVQTFSLNQPDTTLLDTALTPSTGYSWQVQMKKTETTYLKSDAVTGRTMDTTSHDFTWRVDYFGGYSATDLWDIAIVNDTLAFAVGEIHTDPATDPDTGIYKGFWNLAIWNGKIWTLKKLYGSWNGKPFYGYLEWVSKINNNLVWFSNSTYWDGKQFQNSSLIHQAYLLPMSISHLWGDSPDNLYAVGLAGQAAHWDGTVWTPIETGTTLRFLDIWGDGGEVLASCYSFSSFETNIYSLTPFFAQPLNLAGIPYRIRSIWFLKNKVYFAAGEGLFNKRTISDPIWTHFTGSPVTGTMLDHIRGTNRNNIFVSTAFGGLVHYNGSTWLDISQKLDLTQAVLGRISIQNNMVMVAGFSGKGAFVVTGKRN